MKGRTYRYFSDKPLYSFGFGLSYTSFSYSGIKLPSNVKAGDPVNVEAEVKNTGSAAGDEVVELYLTQPKASETPIRVLAAFTRVHLAPGKSAHIGLTIDPRSIAQVDSDGNRGIVPGEYSVSLRGLTTERHDIDANGNVYSCWQSRTAEIGCSMSNSVHSTTPRTGRIAGTVDLAAIEQRFHFIMERNRCYVFLQVCSMRCVVISLLVVGSTLPCAAAKLVTADQLEQLLAASSGESDAQVTAQLEQVVLSERFSAARLSRCEANLPGPHARQALRIMADIAAFLELPPAEIPSLAKPAPKAQREMIALTVNYVSTTIHQLPNFFATRVTNTFQDNPELEDPKPGPNSRIIPNVFLIKTTLYPIGRYNASVLYRDGKEVVRAGATQSGPQGLTTSGEFGPILAGALLDAAQGNLTWSHWEQGTAGPAAVFHFTTPAAKSHYDVAYCCIIKGNGDRVYYRQFSAYDGEITIDPSNGVVLRIVFKAAGLKETDPIVVADILVDYAPVELGGRVYICPVKGIALSLASEIMPSQGRTVEAFPRLQTSLNDISFEQYHLYHATSHILPADKDEQPPNQ